MELHEWEIISDSDDDEKKKIISANTSASVSASASASEAQFVFDMNYFLSPSSMRSIIPVHLQLDSPIPKHPDESLLIMNHKHKVPVEQHEPHPHTVTEFVDMKIDTPRSSNKGTITQFDDQENITNSPGMNLMNNQNDFDAKYQMNGEGSISGLNLLKWSLNGIGAICSFGVAAATMCILIHGGNQQNLRIQIYTNDKKLQQAVQQATRLNEAISAARGLPHKIARITCGGRYHGLQGS